MYFMRMREPFWSQEGVLWLERMAGELREQQLRVPAVLILPEFLIQN